MKTVLISGSARKDGDTHQLVNQILQISDWDLVDLNDYQIGFYDYEHNNRNDDYLPLIHKIIHNYQTLVFATPVYWYAMSAIMKVFFDRFTDLLTIEKELGRKLRQKQMAAISCSEGDHLGEQFWLPFSETARYLGMQYLGHLHTLTGKLEIGLLKEFIDHIDQHKSI